MCSKRSCHCTTNAQSMMNVSLLNDYLEKKKNQNLFTKDRLYVQSCIFLAEAIIKLPLARGIPQQLSVEF